MIGHPEGKNGKMILVVDQPHVCEYPSQYRTNGRRFGPGSIWLCDCGQGWEFEEGWDHIGWKRISHRKLQKVLG